MNEPWQHRREAGSGRMVRFIRWVALDVSTPLARALLLPITAYFLVVRGQERRASRRYLRRALRREPGLLDIARHIHTFATSILDRVAFLAGQSTARTVRVHGIECLRHHLEAGRGVLLFGSHFGSFEAVRQVGFSNREIEVRILMDYQRNPQVAHMLDALNPKARASVIDARGDTTRVLLAIHETLARGGLVGLLADRGHDNEVMLAAELLGSPVGLPLGPYRIAAVTRAPVVLIFGVLQPDGTYDVYFEPFADRIDLRRQHRIEDAAIWASRFAARLEARIREAPFNWFNFYDYWRDEQPPTPAP
ncbi:MAG: lipid A biosynthesis acyltransferase [Steroidobacteraceae bacterium]